MPLEMVMELVLTIIGHLQLSSVKLSLKGSFFSFTQCHGHVKNLVAMLQNVVSILGGKVTIIETLFASLG